MTTDWPFLQSVFVRYNSSWAGRQPVPSQDFANSHSGYGPTCTQNRSSENPPAMTGPTPGTNKLAAAAPSVAPRLLPLRRLPFLPIAWPMPGCSLSPVGTAFSTVRHSCRRQQGNSVIGNSH